ncbi:MAG: sodium:solute symporter family protein [Bdellovibrionales bacterium]|nr:sodium:solute symporter family protein [Bdellovibrionales bacterium]
MRETEYLLDPKVAGGILVLFGLLWIFLGHYLGKKAKNFEGFTVAGRNVGLALGSATVVATWITSNTTMLAPQFALQLGIWGMLAYSTASFGLFLFAPLAQRIQKLMPKGYTSGDFVRLRYGQKTWFVFLLISLFYSITWLISMGMAGGILLQALSGIPYAVGMSVILFVCVMYTLRGGLFAVIGTDFIQSLIILIGILGVGITVIITVPSREIYSNISETSPGLLYVLFPAAIIAIFNNMFFGIGEIVHSNVWWSRAFSIRKGLGGKAFVLGGLFWLPVPIAAGFIALAAHTLGININSPDMVGPLVASKVLGSTGSIVIFIIVFASLASSIDSLLAATVDLLTEDVYRKIYKPSSTDHELRKVSVWITLFLGILAWLVCLPRVGTLASVLFFAGPLVGSTIWPILTGLLWKKANAQGAMYGMLVGSIVGLYAYFTLGWYTASLIGTAVSMLVVLFCTWRRPAAFDWNQLDEQGASLEY